MKFLTILCIAAAFSIVEAASKLAEFRHHVAEYKLEVCKYFWCSSYCTFTII